MRRIFIFLFVVLFPVVFGFSVSSRGSDSQAVLSKFEGHSRGTQRERDALRMIQKWRVSPALSQNAQAVLLWQKAMFYLQRGAYYNSYRNNLTVGLYSGKKSKELFFLKAVTRVLATKAGLRQDLQIVVGNKFVVNRVLSHVQKSQVKEKKRLDREAAKKAAAEAKGKKYVSPYSHETSWSAFLGSGTLEDLFDKVFFRQFKIVRIGDIENFRGVKAQVLYLKWIDPTGSTYNMTWYIAVDGGYPLYFETRIEPYKQIKSGLMQFWFQYNRAFQYSFFDKIHAAFGFKYVFTFNSKLDFDFRRIKRAPEDLYIWDKSPDEKEKMLSGYQFRIVDYLGSEVDKGTGG